MLSSKGWTQLKRCCIGVALVAWVVAGSLIRPTHVEPIRLTGNLHSLRPLVSNRIAGVSHMACALHDDYFHAIQPRLANAGKARAHSLFSVSKCCKIWEYFTWLGRDK